jgi:hypothetical protein
LSGSNPESSTPHLKKSKGETVKNMRNMTSRQLKNSRRALRVEQKSDYQVRKDMREMKALNRKRVPAWTVQERKYQRNFLRIEEYL